MSDSTPHGDSALLVARDTADARALAFAIGTFLRRAGAVGRTLLSSTNAALAPVRDGLVQGLVLTGIDVVDVGVVDDSHASRAAHALSARAELRVAPGDDTRASLTFVVAGAPLSSSDALRIREILEKGDFASGEGVLTVCSPRDILAGTLALSPAAASSTKQKAVPVRARADEAEATGRVKKAGFLEEDTWVDG
jgi:hypothetical protein